MVTKSKMIFWCKFMEITLLIGVLSAPILGQIFAWSEMSNTMFIENGIIRTKCDIPSEIYLNPIAISIAALLRDLIISTILWQLYKIFKDIRLGYIFNTVQIKRLSICGWGFITLSLYLIISSLYLSLLQSPDDELQYYVQLDNLIYVPIGIGLVIFSYVLKLATIIKEEQELVI